METMRVSKHEAGSKAIVTKKQLFESLPG